MPHGTSLRTFLLFIFIFFGGIFTIAACGQQHPKENIPDFTIPGKVVNSWYSKNTRYVQVEVNVKIELPLGSQIKNIHGLYDFSDEYFSTLNPKNGDCVRVWVNL